MNAATSALPPTWAPRPYRETDDQAILDVLQGAFGKWPAVDIDVPPIEHLCWKLHSHVLAPEHHMIAETASSPARAACWFSPFDFRANRCSPISQSISQLRRSSRDWASRGVFA